MIRVWTAAVLLLAGLGAAWAQSAPVRTIEHVAGNLYRFQDNFHYGVFLVGEDGVLLVDPINEGAADWVEGEIRERFGKEVTYVAYSHHHADHVSGGQVFADTARFIGHQNGAAKIAESGHTPVPSITFKWRYQLEFAGETVEFIYPGPTHTDDLVVAHFPAEKALFIVDMATVRRLPYRTLSGWDFPEGIRNLWSVEKIDFEIFVGGHGPLGTKRDLIDHRRYLEALYSAVSHAAKDGLSLKETQERVKMEAYKDWGQYDAWLAENVAGMYKEIAPPYQWE